MERLIRSPKLRWLLLLVFLIPAIGHTAHGAFKGVSTNSCDLQVYWIAGKMLNAGENPYRIWIEDPQATQNYYPESTCTLPEYAYLNTPLNAFLVVPISGMEWEHVRILWLAVQFTFATLTALAVMQLLPQASRDRYLTMLPVVILLGWYAVGQVMRHGQFSLITAFMTFASLVMMYRGRHVLAGIFLGFALCKFSMIWALPLLFLAYRRYSSLAIAIGLQVLGVVLMALATSESLIDIPRTYADALLNWSGQTNGVVSLSRWTTEIGVVSEPVMLATGIGLALLVTLGLFSNVTFGPKRDLSTVPARLEASLFATALILISLTFMYHRYQDMVLTLIVVALWLNLTEIPIRTAIQEQIKSIMATITGILLFANLIPRTIIGKYFEEVLPLIEFAYTAALIIALSMVLWAAWKHHAATVVSVPGQFSLLARVRTKVSFAVAPAFAASKQKAFDVGLNAWLEKWAPERGD